MAPKKDDDESKDLTRIEDLSEFLHQKDTELDSRFDDFAPKDSDFTKTNIETEAEALVSIDGLDDHLDNTPEENTLSFESDSSTDEESLDVLNDFPPDIPIDGENEEQVEQTDFQLSEEISTDELPDVVLHENFDDEASSFSNELSDEVLNEEDAFNSSNTDMFEQSESTDFLNSEPESLNEPLVNTSEKFEDVKTFAHNFSYGKSSGVGGNPPFSIIARNIRYEEEAESILDLLEEFGVVTPQNEKDIKTSLDLGTLLIPQISEYMAIVIAHKLRRFDLDLEVGLSDEIHPSKSGETNPRGLIKKENLKQNKLLQVKLDEIEFKITDIILSTTNSIEGYKIDHYLGIESCFAIIDEEELERLNYVQKSKRESSELLDYQVNDEDFKSAKTSFEEYQDSFNALYEDLRSQLRQKALLKKANALLGFNYQVSPVQFDKGHQRSAAYHITCSATLASISKEADK